VPAIATELDHASLAVDDLDAAVRFYEQAFGYELSFRDTQTDAIAALTGIPGLSCALAQLAHPGGVVLELVRFDGPGPGPEGVGRGHVAFTVGDLAAALAAVTALGARPLGDTVDFATGRAVYALEPGGSIFELYEPARRASPPPAKEPA
jgi:catechol 2,3-dioxygenase-like lactoylglutathione lyase family enzyme